MTIATQQRGAILPNPGTRAAAVQQYKSRHLYPSLCPAPVAKDPRSTVPCLAICTGRKFGYYRADNIQLTIKYIVGRGM
jgi:hypothetical protein